MTVPDHSTRRRIADLERQASRLERELERLRHAVHRQTQPIAGRLWRATLNEDMGATTSQRAAADLVALDGSDTSMDVTVDDLLNEHSSMVNTDECLVVEQYDMDGTLIYAIVTCP